MSRIVERPTVREAVAAGISDGGLDRAAALGSAQLPRGDDGDVLTRIAANEERVRDGRDLGLELAALLLRAKYAGDHGGITMAKYRFALRLRVRSKQYLRGGVRKDKSIVAVASQSIVEWIADRCEKCQGTGIRGARFGGVEDLLRPCKLCRQDGEPTGLVAYKAKGVKPNGKPAPEAAAFRNSDDPYTKALCEAMIGNGMDMITIQCPACRGMRFVVERRRIHAKMGRVCHACGGDGEAPERYNDRARVIGISRDAYWRMWHQWFVWASGHLSSLDKTLVKNLRCELGQGYSPAS